jgi:hypothetical protein
MAIELTASASMVNYPAGEYDTTPLTNVTLTMPSENKSILKSWLQRANMPTARRVLTSSAVNGIIYVIGGISTNTLATVEAYDPVTNTWSTKANMPNARYSLTSSVVNDIIYVIGGVTTVNVSTVEAVEILKTEIWYTIDGTDPAITENPTENAIKYTAPFDLAIRPSKRLKFVVIPV